MTSTYKIIVCKGADRDDSAVTERFLLNKTKEQSIATHSYVVTTGEKNEKYYEN